MMICKMIYRKIYTNSGHLISIKKEHEDGVKTIYISPENSEYKKYLEDIENGAEIIDNPPSQEEVEKNNALLELQKSDIEVTKNISRVIEDYYDTMPLEQQELMYEGFRSAIANKKAKRQKYKDLIE